MYNWYPINFYDAREGENRDNILAGDDSCTTNGVMNAVEIDVGNLKRWLANTSGSGPSVDFLAQNGYVLYFSDRRGMLFNPHPPLGGAAAKAGDSGLEDVINAASANGTPDGALRNSRRRQFSRGRQSERILGQLRRVEPGIGLLVTAASPPT